MSAARIQQRIAARALARGRPLAEALESLEGPSTKVAATFAREGRLFEALRALGHERDLAAAGADWPSGLEPALWRSDAVLSRSLLLLPLVQASAYLGWVAIVEGLVILVLSQWVAPSLAAASSLLGGLSGESADWYGIASAGLLATAVLALALAVVVGVLDWAHLAGWRRPLERARVLAILAGLEESRAPAEVRRAWARRVWGTAEGQEPPPEALDQRARLDDLDALRLDAAALAQSRLDRFVGAFRVVGAALLTLVALLTTLNVYGAVAKLARLP